LARLYGDFKALTTLSIAPPQSGSAAANNLAKSRMTITAAHLFYLFALDVRCFKAKLKMPAKNPLDFRKFPLRQQFA
jgi:hypothetical protein